MIIMNDKGFTLVELMVVLAILGILAAIGIPQYTSVMERSRVGADYATIATVQTAFDVFVAEVGGISKVKIDASIPSDTGVTADKPSKIGGTSIITNQLVTFAAYWDGEDAFPTLKSTEFAGKAWKVYSDGAITPAVHTVP